MTKMNEQALPRRVRGIRLPRSPALWLALLLGASLTSSPTWAGECGDLLPAGRVACACGDTVVTDTILQPADPVVTERCEFDGLVVLADDDAESITLDLAGLTLRGQEMGAGVHVLRGGEAGARITGGGSRGGPKRDGKGAPISTLGRGTVAGFGIGFQALSGARVSRLEHLDFVANRRDGVSLTFHGTIVLDVACDRNGDSGFNLRGGGGRVVAASAAYNRNAGIQLNTRGALVEADVHDNGGHGVIVNGSVNTVKAAAKSNAGVGVLVRGKDHDVEAVGNAKNALGSVVQARDFQRRAP